MGLVRHNGCPDRLSVRVERWKCRQTRALVRKFKGGDPEALLAIYQRYRDYLLSVAMAMVCDMGRAEDAVHDVFVSLAQKRRDSDSAAISRPAWRFPW